MLSVLIVIEYVLFIKKISKHCFFLKKCYINYLADVVVGVEHREKFV